MKELAKRFLRDEKGLETVEWTIMAALIILGLVFAISTLQDEIGNTFNKLETELETAQQSAGT
jgi:Flp pilus assembly pilin Flp